MFVPYIVTSTELVWASQTNINVPLYLTAWLLVQPNWKTCQVWAGWWNTIYIKHCLVLGGKLYPVSVCLNRDICVTD